ncbi:MAG: flagellar hook assembly protein FlgD [Gemmatimonadaceae bacterium]
MATDISTGSLASSLVGPTRNGSVVGPGGKMGKDEFLRLLTTQLRYQDPLDPMDAKDMAADLAQFSGLEQLLNINEQLEAQQGQYASLVTAINNSVAMNTIGKSVVIDADKVVLAKDAQGVVDGKVMADIVTSGNAKLTLYDKSGKEVGSRSLGYLGTGARQEFDIGSAAQGVTEGAYSFKITVTDAASGKEVPQQTYTVGKIDGMTIGQDGKAMLMMGPFVLDFASIVEILS